MKNYLIQFTSFEEGGADFTTKIVWPMLEDIGDFVQAVLWAKLRPLQLFTVDEEILVIPNDVLQKTGIIIKEIEIDGYVEQAQSD
jgi:hypothetical protein